MKNTKITNKYILALQALALVAVFLVARPLSALADDYTDPSYSTYSDPSYSSTYDDPSSQTYSDPSYSTTYADPSYTTSNTQTYADPSYTTYSDPSFTTTYTPTQTASAPEYDVTYSPYSSGYDVTYTPYSPAYTNYGGGYYLGSGYNSAPSYSGGYYGTPNYAGQGFAGGNTIIVLPATTTYVGNANYVNPGFTGGYNYGSNYQLTGSCYASINTAQVGTSVTWTVTANGGNGSYQYSWSGDEGLSSTGQTVFKTYSYAGTKNATVMIYSTDGQSISRTCSVIVGPNVVGNQVLAYSDTATPLTGVYLSDVPYTGAGDVVRVISFILALIAWSTLLAYYFMKRKYNVNIFAPVVAEAQTKDSNVATDTLTTKIASDTAEISFVEEYARMKKVILSTDAAVKLVKIQKLGKGSAIEIIDNLSGTEWTAVGENDLVNLV